MIFIREAPIWPFGHAPIPPGALGRDYNFRSVAEHVQAHILQQEEQAHEDARSARLEAIREQLESARRLAALLTAGEQEDESGSTTGHMRGDYFGDDDSALPNFNDSDFAPTPAAHSQAEVFRTPHQKAADSALGKVAYLAFHDDQAYFAWEALAPVTQRAWINTAKAVLNL